MAGPVPPARSWARDAVIYQVYVRSFADSDGDGIGDLSGVTSRLDYLAELGVDAVWLTPFYPSPMADGGYDVADYRGVDPTLGTLADFDRLVSAAHDRHLRVVIDIVPNHCSSEHPWFRAALTAAPGSPERARFHFRPGIGERSELPPNDWESVFRGRAWTRVPDGEWYLHLFAPEQPDLNWDNADVREEFAATLRFWLERGVDGIRIDVAHGLVKAPGLPDLMSWTDAGARSPELLGGAPAPFFDQEGVHEIYRQWRSIMDGYAPERIAVAEAWLDNLPRMARYVRPGELHQAFNFAFLSAPWSPTRYRQVIDESLSTMDSVGAPTTWVLSNHDVVRHATRLATGAGGTAGGVGRYFGVSGTRDTSVGLRRARAATLTMLALPGSAYLYQGEELGLPEVLDLPAEARQDPIFVRTRGAELGRDGCRVPLPWSGEAEPYGFAPPGSIPWLPQPPEWADLSVAVQRADPGSTWSMYAAALRLRREQPACSVGVLTWLDAPTESALAFTRTVPGAAAVVVALNFGPEPLAVEAAAGVAPALCSGELDPDGRLPADTAAWWVIEP